eukprot:TRINITY_DN2569_c0_g1_i1.p1 TRINITY_DN2569_c0_g1~~TRINITY_DN2569_c0_g1_i1.p1  ORF type:complete len:296 (-),score=31.86 TRINITY_DN2569_c0_g1_i1:234-1121(-)
MHSVSSKIVYGEVMVPQKHNPTREFYRKPESRPSDLSACSLQLIPIQQKEWSYAGQREREPSSMYFIRMNKERRVGPKAVDMEYFKEVPDRRGVTLLDGETLDMNPIHARFSPYADNPSWVQLWDEGSAQGTFVEIRRDIPLSKGDILDFGSLNVEIIDASSVAGLKMRIIYALKDDLLGRDLKTTTNCLIGTDEKSLLRLPHDEKLEKEHVKFYLAENKWFVQNPLQNAFESSPKSVWLRLSKSNEVSKQGVFIKTGDIVRFGYDTMYEVIVSPTGFNLLEIKNDRPTNKTLDL